MSGGGGERAEKLRRELGKTLDAVATAADPWPAAARLVAAAETIPTLSTADGLLGPVLTTLLERLPVAPPEATGRAIRARAALRLAEVRLAARDTERAAKGLRTLAAAALPPGARARWALARTALAVHEEDREATVAALGEADAILASGELEEDALLLASYAVAAGEATLMGGLHDQARQLLLVARRRALAIGPKADAIQIRADLALAELALAVDDPAEAYALARRAAAGAAAHRARLEELQARRMAAEAALLTNDPGGALGEVKAARDGPVPLAARGLLPGFRLAEGRARLAIGYEDDARRSFEEVVADPATADDERALAERLLRERQSGR